MYIAIKVTSLNNVQQLLNNSRVGYCSSLLKVAGKFRACGKQTVSSMAK